MDLLKLKGFNNIYTVDAFEKEFKKIFKKDEKDYIQYLKRLRSKLKLLDKYNRAIVNQVNTIESLKNSELFAIRLIGKHNVRVIFAVVISNEIVLLQSFEERNREDYKLALRIANNRLKMVGEKDG